MEEIKFRKVKSSKTPKKLVIDSDLYQKTLDVIQGKDGKLELTYGEKQSSKDAEEAFSSNQKLNRNDKLAVLSKSDKTRATLPKFELESIFYNPLTSDNIRKQAVFQCRSTSNEGSRKNTCNDDRLGALEKGCRCSSCGELSIRCPGHCSFIDLRGLIIFPVFRSVVMTLLKCFCHSCSKPLLSKERLKKIRGGTSMSRLRQLANISEGLSCSNPSCPPNPIIAPDTLTGPGLSAHMKGSAGKKGEGTLLSVEKIYNIFNKIEQEDLVPYGFSDFSKEKKIDSSNLLENKVKATPWTVHPRDYIGDTLCVIALQARRYVRRDAIIRDHPITEKYRLIQSLIEQLKASDHKPDLEQQLIKTIYNEVYKMVYASPDPQNPGGFSGVAAATKGKGGFIRESLTKRGNQSARSPIDPFGELEFGEIGIPISVFEPLSVPEVVTYYNFKRIMRYCDEGKIQRITPKGTNTSIHYNPSKKLTIKIGDSIERSIENGDIVVFNRQPTIHKGSMSSFKVKLTKGKVICIHLSSCKPKGADFDGDEGNVTVPQTPGGIAEAIYVSNERKNISNVYSSNSNGIVQNATTGWYSMTSLKEGPSEEHPFGIDSRIFSPEEFEEYLSKMKASNTSKITREEMKKRIDRAAKYYYYTYSKKLSPERKSSAMDQNWKKYRINPNSARALFSYCLPEDFSYQNGEVHVVMGVLIKGQVKSSSIGDSPFSMIKVLDKVYGGEIASDFISNITFAGYWYVERIGFTIGLNDCLLPEDVKKDMFVTRKEILDELNRKFNNMKETPGMSQFQKEELEEQRKNMIKDAEDRIMSPYIKKIPKENNLNDMIDSGSKGKPTSRTDMMFCVGQQKVENERLKKEISRGRRAMYSRDENDESVEGRGFCSTSYTEGLDLEGFYSNSYSSRAAICATHVDVASAGHQGRLYGKSCEDLMIGVDGTIRNDSESIISACFPFDIEQGVIVDGKMKPINVKMIEGLVNQRFFNKISSLRF